MGIMSSNRIEWIVADLACMMYGFVSVPLIAGGQGFLEKVLDLSSCRVIVCARDCTLKLIDLKRRGHLAELKFLVQIEALQYPEMSAVELLEGTLSADKDSADKGFLQLPPSTLHFEESFSPLMPLPSAIAKLRLYAFNFVEESGSHSLKDPVASKMSDLATIVFTQVVVQRNRFVASFRSNSDALVG